MSIYTEGIVLPLAGYQPSTCLPLSAQLFPGEQVWKLLPSKAFHLQSIYIASSSQVMSPLPQSLPEILVFQITPLSLSFNYDFQKHSEPLPISEQQFTHSETHRITIFLGFERFLDLSSEMFPQKWKYFLSNNNLYCLQAPLSGSRRA